MLTAIGSVLAIVDDNLVLIEARTDLSSESVVQVFSRVSAKSLQLPDGSAPLEEIDIPKGYLKIVLQQTETFYLAERYRETKERTRVIRKSNPLAEALLSYGRGVPLEELVELVPGEWSAQLDRVATPRVRYRREIQAGDLVSKL